MQTFQNRTNCIYQFRLALNRAVPIFNGLPKPSSINHEPMPVNIDNSAFQYLFSRLPWSRLHTSWLFRWYKGCITLLEFQSTLGSVWPWSECLSSNICNARSVFTANSHIIPRGAIPATTDIFYFWRIDFTQHVIIFTVSFGAISNCLGYDVNFSVLALHNSTSETH